VVGLRVYLTNKGKDTTMIKFKSNKELTTDQFKQKYLLSGQLYEVHKITEWRNNCIWKTRKVGYMIGNCPTIAINRNIGAVVSISTDETARLCDLPLWFK